jgi:hypothetical protein
MLNNHADQMSEEILKTQTKLLALIIQQDGGVEESEKAYVRTFRFNIGFLCFLSIPIYAILSFNLVQNDNLLTQKVK